MPGHVLQWIEGEANKFNVLKNYDEKKRPTGGRWLRQQWLFWDREAKVGRKTRRAYGVPNSLCFFASVLSCVGDMVLPR
jgi:hypothetical protein